MPERKERRAAEQLLSEVRDEESFDALFTRVADRLKRLKEGSPSGRLGYVSGIISSDGPEHVDRNREVLQEKTQRARQNYDFPVFSANDIFTPDLVDRLGHKSSNYNGFWRKILATGLVTDVIMTMGWERSVGATDEHTTAEIFDLNIIYERSPLAFKPPTGFEPQDTIRRLFIAVDEDAMKTKKTAGGEVWTRSEHTLGSGRSVLISNASEARIAVRAVKPDQVFQYGLDENGVSWIDGVYKASVDKVREVYEPKEIRQGEEDRIYLKEFFGAGRDGQLLADVLNWTRTIFEIGEIEAIPASAREHIKPGTWSKLRL